MKTEYPIIEKIILKYVYSQANERKGLILRSFHESASSSLYSYFDNEFFKLGLISSNIDILSSNKCRSYLKFDIDNYWSKEPGFLELSDKYVSFNNAQEFLGNELIKLIDKIEFLN